MPDFERLTDSLRIFSSNGVASREWARGYTAGKTRARIEVVAIVVALYFGIALIGKYFGQ